MVRCYGRDKVEPKQKMEIENDSHAFAAFYRAREGEERIGGEGEHQPAVVLH
jgi:hypothetical protein